MLEKIYYEKEKKVVIAFGEFSYESTYLYKSKSIRERAIEHVIAVVMLTYPKKHIGKFTRIENIVECDYCNTIENYMNCICCPIFKGGTK
jgi:hypothetical protein